MLQEPSNYTFTTVFNWVHDNGEFISDCINFRKKMDTYDISYELIELAKENKVILVDENTGEWDKEIYKYFPSQGSDYEKWD